MADKKTEKTVIAYKGKEFKSAADLARSLDLNPSAIRGRLRAGMTINDAVNAAQVAAKARAEREKAMTAASFNSKRK